MTSDLVTYLRALDTAICQRNEARAEVDSQRAENERLTRERNEARAVVEKLRAENDELCRAAGRTRAALSGWVLASPGREDEPTHELVAEVVAEAERLRFQRSLRKLRDKP